MSVLSCYYSRLIENAILMKMSYTLDPFGTGAVVGGNKECIRYASSYMREFQIPLHGCINVLSVH